MFLLEKPAAAVALRAACNWIQTKDNTHAQEYYGVDV